MFKFLFASFFVGFCDGSLLKGTVLSPGSTPSGGDQSPMTDNHYLLLKDLIALERQNQDKLKQSLTEMESIVLQLQQQLTTTQQEVASLKANKDIAQVQSVVEVKNETTTMKNTIDKMKGDHNSLRNYVEDLQHKLVKVFHFWQNETTTLKNMMNKIEGDHISLRNTVEDLQHKLEKVQIDNNALKTDDNNLKTEVENLRNFTQLLRYELGSVAASGTQNMSTLKNDMQSLKVIMSSVNANISVLSSNSFSCSKDCLALVNQTDIANQKIDQLKNKAKDFENKAYEQSMTISGLIAKQNSLKNNLDIMGNVTTNLLRSQTEGVAILQQRIINLENEQGAQVVLTSCGTGAPTTYSYGENIKFTSTKSVYGITKLADFHSTGKFICEKPGTYLFSVFIMSSTVGSKYALYKENERISLVYVSGDSDYHTGTSTVAVLLDKGDRLYATAVSPMVVKNGFSCFTVIKIG